MNDDPDPSSPSIDITLADPRWLQDLPGVEELVKHAAFAAYRAGDPIPALADRPVEISLVLADDEEVRCLNRDYRGKDRATNVLSFASSDDDLVPAVPGQPCLLGDVIIARGVCLQEARQQAKDLSAHLTHLVVHGLLHLLGYDHEENGEAVQMESLETQILKELGFSDPYHSQSGDNECPQVEGTVS